MQRWPASQQPKTMNMYQQCFTQIEHAIANWSAIDVRTVPNVMYQVRFGCDLNDSSTDYQLNWFADCTETIIQNHRHSFDTLCLEGEYLETSWDVVNDQRNNVIYKLRRKSDGTLDVAAKLPGVLRPVKTRRHFPGNKMHVNTKLYHSISPIGGTKSQVVTFLKKRTCSSVPPTYVLSLTPTCEGPVEEIRPATAGEREKMYHKLQEILAMKSKLLTKRS